jgi:hypothetical protein
MSVRMKQLGSHWLDYRESFYLGAVLRSIDIFQFWLKSDSNNGHFT